MYFKVIKNIILIGALLLVFFASVLWLDLRGKFIVILVINVLTISRMIKEKEHIIKLT